MPTTRANRQRIPFENREHHADARSVDGTQPPVDLDQLRDLTLQKIGRSCVNFAKMEGLLRVIVTNARVSAPASGIATVFATRQKAFRRTSMGALTEAAADALHLPAPPPPEDLTESWFRFEVSLADGGSVRNEWRAVMRNVVRERNRLLHQRLAEWNSYSAESCRALCADLDDQRERMRQPHEHLIAVVRNIRQLQSEAVLALRSEFELE